MSDKTSGPDTRVAEPPGDHEQVSLAAGRAAGYCRVQNSDGPGRCTWPPSHRGMTHKDVYAHTEW
jgi:hypothetical protein